MKITVENFNSSLKAADVTKLPSVLKESYQDVKQMLDLYDDDVDIKKFIDVYVSKLNQALSKSDTKTVKPKSTRVKPKHNSNPTKEKVNPSSSNSKSEKSVQQVAEIALEVRFIKRYVLMDGKKKTRKQLLAFINTLQRALTKKQINKSSKYAKQIEHIEKELVKIYNDDKVGNTFTFRLDDSDKMVVDKFTKIAHSQQLRTSVRLISRFIGIHGRSSVKEKAERLLQSVKKALKNKKVVSSDPYYKKVKLVEKNLQDYIAAKEEKLVISDAKLRGLQGVVFPRRRNDRILKLSIPESLNVLKSNHSGIISSLEMSTMEHHTCGFTGKWLSLIGDPSSPFSMMFWSKPGKGKSSLAIELAHYIASKFDKKVLFVAVEEGFNYTIQEKFDRLNAVHPNIDIASSMPDSLTAYDIIFIDSVNRAKMVVDDFVSLKEKYPNKSFVLIFQATVDGNYRGGKEWEHEVDVSININENGYAKTQKSRFGGNGSIKVFQGNTDHIYKFSNLQDAEKFVANRKDEKLRIVNGDDGRKWVTNTDKAQELKKQGYELY